MLTATAPDGRPVFRGRVPEEGAAPAPVAAIAAAVAAPSPPARAPRSMSPPGQLQLRMVVENSRGQVIDSATQELTVPDFTDGRRCRSARRGSTAPARSRELQALKANPTRSPTAEREFSRTERLLVRVDAYAPGGVRADRHRAAAQPRRHSRWPTCPCSTAAGGRPRSSCRSSSLAAGDYLIELNAKTASRQPPRS